MLNGKTSECFPVKAPQGSIICLLFFLIYINDLSDDLVSTVKLFADGTSLFSIVHDNNISVYELKISDISEWVYKWKMSLKFDFNKQAQEVVFSRKLNKSSYPNLFFNNGPNFMLIDKSI